MKLETLSGAETRKAKTHTHTHSETETETENRTGKVQVEKRQFKSRLASPLT